MTKPYSYRSDPNVPAFNDELPIVVFDGNCVLCSHFAQFIMRTDKRARIRLLPAQSKLGTALYVHYGLDPEKYSTNILLQDGRAWFKSASAIKTFGQLGSVWRLASLGWILPRIARDALYNLVARNRLRWFGVRETCFMPAVHGDADREVPLIPARQTPMFRKLLGEDFEQLPQPVRIMHDLERRIVANGHARVQRGRNVFAQLAATIANLPHSSARVPVQVMFDANAAGELWTRQFGDHVFSSEQWAERGLLFERLGPVTVGSDLQLENGRMRLALRRWRLFGVPLPRFLAVRSDTYEYVEDGVFAFHARISHPFCGLIVAYEGTLSPATPIAPHL